MDHKVVVGKVKVGEFTFDEVEESGPGKPVKEFGKAVIPGEVPWLEQRTEEIMRAVRKSL